MSDSDIRGLCIVKGCTWMTTLPDGPDAVAAAHQLIAAHREHEHPNHQLQVKKCPICPWQLGAYSLPGDDYSADRVRLQHEWSKHMVDDHPSVRGPGTIQVTARLFPYGVPSADDRVIAEDAVISMPEGGVPIVNGRGEPVGRADNARTEDNWMIVDGFLREDLVSELDRANLWRGRTIPVHFAIRAADSGLADGKLVTDSGVLTGVHVSDSDVTVWEGMGMKALHPRLDAEPEQADTPEPPSEGETRPVAPTGIDTLAMNAAVQGVSASLRPLQDAMEAWAAALTPAIQAFAQALAEHAKAVVVKPEPMVVKVAAADADFFEEHAPPVNRYTCTCAGLPVPHVPGGPNCLRRPPSVRQWDGLYGAVPEPLEDASATEDASGLRVEGRLSGEWRLVPESRPLDYAQTPPAPEGPEDWPRLPRNGKRAPVGCDTCEAPVDGRHPAGCPGA